MYDASRCAKCHARMGCVAQVSGIACLVGVQRTLQNNGNVKSGPKYQYVLSTFELFLVLLSLSWFLRRADFFFLRVASCWQRSAFIYALGSAKYVCCKGPATLSSPFSVTKKCHPNVIVYETGVISSVSLSSSSVAMELASTSGHGLLTHAGSRFSEELCNCSGIELESAEL